MKKSILFLLLLLSRTITWCMEQPTLGLSTIGFQVELPKKLNQSQNEHEQCIKNYYENHKFTIKMCIAATALHLKKNDSIFFQELFESPNRSIDITPAKNHKNNFNVYFMDTNRTITPEIYNQIYQKFCLIPAEPRDYEYFFEEINNLSKNLNDVDKNKNDKLFEEFNTKFTEEFRKEIQQFWKNYSVTKSVRIRYDSINNKVKKIVPSLIIKELSSKQEFVPGISLDANTFL